MTDKNSPKNHETTSMFLNVLLIIIWGFWFGILCLWLLSENNKIDTLSDAFNMLGVVTSIIAVVLVYMTYKTQKEELLLTRQELKNSTEMMSQQKEIMDEENFRNHFSFLLEQKEKMKNSIIYLGDQKHEELRGEKFFNKSAEIILSLDNYECVLGGEELEERWKSFASYCNDNKQQLKRYQKFSNFIKEELLKKESLKKESLRNNDFTLIYDTTVSEDEKFFFERIWDFVGKYGPQEQ